MSGRPARRALVALLACALCGLAAAALLPSGEAGAPASGGEGPGQEAGVSSGLSGSVTAEQVVGAAEVTRGESARDVAEEAARALEELEGRGDCVLVRAGYLDLSGRVWGCVVQGAGWSEVRLVSEGASGSEVVTLRMDAEDLRERLGAP